MMSIFRAKFHRAAVAAFATVAATATSALATERIAPSDPGGAWDFTCRSVGRNLMNLDLVDGSVQVTNMSGGVGAVAFAHVASKRADDEDLIVATSTVGITQIAQNKYPGGIDVMRYVAMLGADVGIIAVDADSPYKTLDVLIAALKKDPTSVVAGGRRRAEEAGVIYSMAYGDQPALACDLVDWARACGFNVIAGGRGHKWLPHYRQSTPDTVWDHWGLTREQAEPGRLNPKMFNAFLDGSKPAIESAAIANATGLDAPEDGLVFPPGGIDDVPNLMRPESEGGILKNKGMVDVVSCLNRDGNEIPHDIRKGVWVCFEGDTEYLRNCFEEYRVVTDSTGRYMGNYKRRHLIGLELAISAASIGLRGEPTGAATEFRADVAAIAKRHLRQGEILDGKGGFTVSGGLRPARTSLKNDTLPLGLAHDVRLRRDVREGAAVTWDDVEIDKTTAAYRLRKQVEKDAAERLAFSHLKPRMPNGSISRINERWHECGKPTVLSRGQAT